MDPLTMVITSALVLTLSWRSYANKRGRAGTPSRSPRANRIWASIQTRIRRGDCTEACFSLANATTPDSSNEIMAGLGRGSLATTSQTFWPQSWFGSDGAEPFWPGLAVLNRYVAAVLWADYVQPPRNEDREAYPCCCHDPIDAQCQMCPQHGELPVWHAFPRIERVAFFAKSREAWCQ